MARLRAIGNGAFLTAQMDIMYQIFSDAESEGGFLVDRLAAPFKKLLHTRLEAVGSETSATNISYKYGAEVADEFVVLSAGVEDFASDLLGAFSYAAENPDLVKMDEQKRSELQDAETDLQAAVWQLSTIQGDIDKERQRMAKEGASVVESIVSGA